MKFILYFLVIAFVLLSLYGLWPASRGAGSTHDESDGPAHESEEDYLARMRVAHDDE